MKRQAVRRALVCAIQRGGFAGLVALVDELRQLGPGEGDDDDEDDELPWPPDPPPAAVQVRGRRTAGMISLASQLLNRPHNVVCVLTSSRGPAAPVSEATGAGARSTTFAPNVAACRALSRFARATAEACDGVNEACEAPKCAHPDEPLKLVGSRPKPAKAAPGTSLPNAFFMHPIYPATMG